MGIANTALARPPESAAGFPGSPQRIVLFSERGDLHFTEQERQQARTLVVSHEFLRTLGRAPAITFMSPRLEPPSRSVEQLSIGLELTGSVLRCLELALMKPRENLQAHCFSAASTPNACNP